MVWKWTRGEGTVLYFASVGRLTISITENYFIFLLDTHLLNYMKLSFNIYLSSHSFGFYNVVLKITSLQTCPFYFEGDCKYFLINTMIIHSYHLSLIYICSSIFWKYLVWGYYEFIATYKYCNVMNSNSKYGLEDYVSQTKPCIWNGGTWLEICNNTKQWIDIIGPVLEWYI